MSDNLRKDCLLTLY